VEGGFTFTFNILKVQDVTGFIVHNNIVERLNYLFPFEGTYGEIRR